MYPRFNTIVAVAALMTGGTTNAAPIAYSGAVTTYTVLQTGIYSLSAEGAGGGASHGPLGLPNPGAGESIAGDLVLTAGTILSIAVGGAGAGGFSVGGSGGGGTFIYVGSTPFLIAGGGGGAGFFGPGSNATGPSNAASSAGAGGANAAGGNGGGGAGFTSNGSGGTGLNSGTGGSDGPSFAGGTGQSGGGPGGFGGGGGQGFNGGGGGGGYSGGNGGDGTPVNSGGTGGSSFAMTDFTNLVYASANNATGNGMVDIEFIGPAAQPGTVPEPASLALAAVGGLAGLRFRRRRRRSN